MALKENDHDIEQSIMFQPVLPKPVFVLYYVVVLPNSSGYKKQDSSYSVDKG